MLICEAVKEAQNSNKYIARLHHSFKIKPTNEPECCIVVKKNKPSAKRWNPKAEDLMADDWNVVN